MKLNLFNLRQTFDVRQLKKSLWDHINPKLINSNNDQQNEEEQQIEAEEEINYLNMTDIMYDMYTGGEVDNKAVSINSAFICMLHLANEQSLRFEPMSEGAEFDFMVSKDLI